MNPKNTLLLLAMTAGLFAFIFFFERHLHKTAVGSVKVIPDFKAQAVTAIRIELDGQRGEIRVERTNGGWQLTKPLAYPARSAAVEGLLQAVAELAPQTHISAQELKGQLSVNEEYGFANSQATIVFQQGTDARTLNLGRLTAPGDQIYAQVVGLDGVDIINADFFKKMIPRQANDWRETIFANLNGQAFDGLTVFANGAQAFELRQDATNQPWRMTKPRVTRADYPKIDALLFELEKMRVSRFETDGPRADLEGYGLQPAILELKFEQKTNPVLSLQFGKSPTNEPGQIYARCNGQNTIVLVPREYISPWQAGFQEFRDRHLVRLAGGLPAVIDVRGIENFTIERQTNDTWRITQPLALPADDRLMKAFLNRLTDLEVARGNNGVAVSDTALDSDLLDYGLVKPSRQYVLKRDAPAGASNAVLAELDFGLAREKDGIIFARRGDHPEETSVYAVKLADFQDLPGTSLQLRARRIWNFLEDDVASVTIRQNGQERQLTRKGPKSWSVTTGNGIINSLEVELGAEELGMLEAGDWVERGDEDRARFGFNEKSPRLTVELNIKGKTSTLMLDFGGLSPGGTRYGDVRMDDGQNWIFEFPGLVAEQLMAWFHIE